MRVTSARVAQIGNVLEKVGNTTGLTRARVDGVGSYEGVGASFHLIPLDTDRGVRLICDRGDSGAIWYDPDTGAGVGVHCRGHEQATLATQYGIASDLGYAMRRLKVKF